MHNGTTSPVPGQGAVGWHKSSYSNDPNNNCVEQGVSDNGEAVAVRDTKENGLGGVLRLRPAAWGAFVDAVKGGEFRAAP
ncbi:DUF397 domain-containing protein [Kitasatospora sp. NBC_01287]|uniref:DUF397 domain-containing protein n=1 Tax=Kitasatospora sp. NBC_01287 TaxID=2903573 RepID=UPI00225763AA|nr:DUF397 domain-containing protein [Kitasatospora sp. NBC_01287]MCX4751604.1 DUF397 domain-containing protein [Kitasatospora sp. NBC_01287]